MTMTMRVLHSKDPYISLISLINKRMSPIDLYNQNGNTIILHTIS